MINNDKVVVQKPTIGEFRKLLSAFAFLSLWGAIFLILHIFHMRFIIVDVIFYATLKDLILSFFIVILLYFLVKKKLSLSFSNLILSTLVGLSGGYIFAITIPTVIDRSLSAYILEKFVQRGGEIKQGSLNKIFVDEYIPEFQLMNVRLQEAISSGTLVLDNDCIKITKKGKKIANFTKYYRYNFLPKKRRLLGRVTDELTDPYRSSSYDVDYLCAQIDTKETR